MVETPPTRWLPTQAGAPVASETGTPSLVRDLALRGLDQMLAMAVDEKTLPDLPQVGPSVESFGDANWILTHADDSYLPEEWSKWDQMAGMF